MIPDVGIDSEKYAQYRQYCERTGNAPRVSVIVPVYEDPEGLRRTVEALYCDPYDALEILVRVEPSTGETVSVADRLATEYEAVQVDVSVRYDTPAAARNAGLDDADGEVVVFLDADVVPEPEFLWKVAFVVDNSSVQYLGVPVELRRSGEGQTLVGWYDSHVRYPVEFYLKGVKFAPTCALAVERSVAEAIRFESPLISAEDVLFGKRAYSAGFEFAFCPDIVVSHPVRDSLREILDVGEKTGRGFCQLYHHLPESMSSTRPRPLTLDAYTPPPKSRLERICRGWDDMSLFEKFGIVCFSHFEVLARTLGYLKQSIEERRSDE